MKEKARELLRRGAEEIGIAITENEIGKFGMFADELKKWNRKINLTAITDDSAIVVKHFLDSLTLLKTVGGQGSLLDIGSGGGFPAIPLKIMSRELNVTSVDAVEKKIIFQRHVMRTLQLHDFCALHARGEELAAKHAGTFDWVVSRAFSDIPTFVNLALPLLSDGGKIVAMKGKGGLDEVLAAEKSLSTSGARIIETVELRLPISGDSRILVVIARA